MGPAMGRLDIEGVLTGAWERFSDDPVDFLVLGLMAGMLPFLAALAVAVALWGSGVLILLGSQASDPQQWADLFQGLFGTGQGLVGFLVVFLGGMLAAILVAGAVWALFYGALLARSRARDAAHDIGSALEQGADRWLSMFGVVVVVAVAFFVLLGIPGTLIFWGVVQGLGGDAGAALSTAGFGVLGLLVGGIFALFLALAWFVAPPAVVAEEVSTRDALRRSWELTENKRLPILVVVIVGLVAGAIVNALVGFAATPLSFVGNDLSWIGSIVGTALAAPIWPLLSTLSYEQLAGETAPEDEEDEHGPSPPEGYVPVEPGS